MTRNTENRVEVACPVYDADVKANLNHILDVMLSDNVKARRMLSNGCYIPKVKEGEEIVAQELFMQEAMENKVEVTKPKRSLLDKLFAMLKG